MKNKPKVSIIIPTYNREKLLLRAIKSVLNQTFRDFELIIVDDGSTDNTKKLVLDFQKKDSRIKYIWQENSGSCSSPKNSGIKISKGEYLAFLDSDDEWFPEKLEKQLNLFKNSESLGIVACNCWLVDTNRETKKMHKIENIVNKNDLSSKILEKIYIKSPSSTLIKAEVFNKIGFFDEKLKISDDWDMWIRILKRYNFNFVKEPLFNYYIHSSNLSGEKNTIKKIKDILIILKKHKKDYQKNKKAKAKLLKYVGTYYMILGNTKKSRKYILKSIKCNPSDWENYSKFIFTFLGVRAYKMKNKVI